MYGRDGLRVTSVVCAVALLSACMGDSAVSRSPVSMLGMSGPDGEAVSQAPASALDHQHAQVEPAKCDNAATKI